MKDTFNILKDCLCLIGISVIVTLLLVASTLFVLMCIPFFWIKEVANIALSTCKNTYLILSEMFNNEDN